MAKKDETEQEKLTRITNDQMNQQKEFARKRKLQGIYEAEASAVRHRAQKDLQKEQGEANKYFRKIEDYRNQPRSNQTYHVGSVASWMMESEDRFKNIVKFIVHRQKAFRKEKIGAPVRSALAGYSTWAANWLYEKSFGEYDIENPNFRYSVELGDNGQLYADWFEESFGDLFLDEEGNYVPKEAGEINALLQQTMHLWIESLDGLDPEEPQGYFIVKVGDNPENSVVYPKSVGKLENGNWVLDKDILREHYADDQLEGKDGQIVPSLTAEPKSGKENLYINKEKFAQMMDGFGNPDKNIENFVASIFTDTDLELEPPSTGYRP